MSKKFFKKETITNRINNKFLNNLNYIQVKNNVFKVLKLAITLSSICLIFPETTLASNEHVAELFVGTFINILTSIIRKYYVAAIGLITVVQTIKVLIFSDNKKKALISCLGWAFVTIIIVSIMLFFT